MKKILFIILIVTVALFLLITVFGFFYLGGIVKYGIQQVGSQMTKVSVKVNLVNVAPLAGSASLIGLTIGNPGGFSSSQCIKVGNISVDLDPYSVTSSKVMIHSVRVDSPEVDFEQGLGGNNLSKILSNVQLPQNNGPAPKIEIDDFVITGGKVNVIIAGVVNKVVSLPDIHLTDLGQGNGGLTPAEITRAILRSILTATLKAVAGSMGGLNQMLNMVTNTFK